MGKLALACFPANCILHLSASDRKYWLEIQIQTNLFRFGLLPTAGRFGGTMINEMNNFEGII